MATGISAVATAAPYRRLIQRPAKAPPPANRVPWRCFAKQSTRRLSMVKKKSGVSEVEMVKDLKVIVEEKMGRKKAERDAYLVAAIVSSFGITSMAAIAVYYRFSWQLKVGMEFWARWAHKQLWHDTLWNMHKSHHRARDGPFELNDVFAIINAVPAIALLSFGFFNQGFFPGLCFGAGLGITVFGMAYMFVHDGLVHRRFPVGPIAAVPYLRRVAAAHHIHHTDKFDGVPYGLFLGPKELEDVDGEEELQKEIKKRSKVYRN
ncbi:beta-carotene 3-hydroxylase 1, chloroplastic-like isoform X3 [Cucurbita pepo subsp. pepo]|uniref:beta-carotene 3-hydroxylase 1, chloroplastic-like isoform X3 n=1 Tax=Cucurbita pepo subsp. pepo TaxID=3664 RepID=UPI000C9D7F78|nr:beta-carotene 3-hydroxylase 1, chloroplastic-like isoform X3 [Cucurbita pepo subsp. pepo]